MADKKHLSPTQLKMYLRCSAQYYFRYIEGLKIPPGLALVLGRSTDTAISHNLAQKIETDKDLGIDEVVDVFTTTFDHGIKDAALWPDEKPEEEREITIGAVKVYHQELVPDIHPAAVQEKIEIDLGDFPFGLLEYPDCRTRDGLIIDQKTAGKSPPGISEGKPRPASFDDQLQLFLYDVGERALGNDISGLRLDYLVKNKTPKAIPVPFEATPDDRRFVMNLIGRVADAITNEIWIPNRGHFLCSERFCGFWHECHKTF